MSGFPFVVERGRARRVVQVSWIVPDVEKAALAWVATTGMGPFFVFKHIPVEEARYRGEPATIDFSVAIAQSGGLQIEFIQQDSPGPSAYRDLIAAGKSGFHHIALYCAHYDEDLSTYTQQGHRVAFEGKFAGKRYCYVDTSATIGCMVELIEDSAVQREFFTRIADAATDWDGREPLRSAFG